MLQIKEFAELCGCTTSILRYYDNKDILKPFFIEPFTGYRYYQYQQALEFCRIKQLQEAGLTIKEIRATKNKSEQEIVEILKEKLAEQKNVVHSIENVIETYQESKMNIEKMIMESNELFSLKVEVKEKGVTLSKKGESISLHFLNDAMEISTLLKDMQKQTLIGFESFDDLKDVENKVWNHTNIISGWETKEELLEKIEETNTSKALCVHLFNINESIDLFAISEIVESTKEKGYVSENSFFNVSLSTDCENYYAIMYIDC